MDLKNKIHLQLYSAYKRLTSEIRTHTGCEGMEKVFHANKNEKKLAIVLSDKIDFKTKIIIKDKGIKQ